jgi:hypothetical protein
MLSEYEASILTRFRQNNRTSEARSLGPKPAAIGLALTLVAIWLAGSGWLAAAEPDPPVAATGAVLAQSRMGADAGALRTGSRKSERQASVEFFFGFLEFDWDGNKPGGVPGFSSYPAEASRLDLVTAGE